MRLQLLAVVLVLAMACKGDRPKMPPLSETMPELPVPPAAEVISNAGGEDALQIRFKSAGEPEEIATYYRSYFSKNNWRLVSDIKTREGVIVMYAEGTKRPLWVTITKAGGQDGSLVDIAGAKGSVSNEKATSPSQ
jgi:hypothetical protein